MFFNEDGETMTEVDRSPRSARFDPARFSLDDRYTTRDGEVLLTGVQGLVRLVIDQLRHDRARSMRTAAFVSGYPGSPLGGFDQALERAPKGDVEVHHMPGLNEELAATAIWGSQQNNLATLHDRDAVIGLWYGKSPGLDRCGDVLRHANQHGVGHNGGVVLAVGDDPSSKSSTLPGASEAAMFDLGIPALAPGTVGELLRLGHHGYAMSRYTGLWAGLKITTALADGFAITNVNSQGPTFVDPQVEFDGVPWVYQQRPRFFIPDTVELEQELYEKRLPAAEAYAAANGLNRITISAPDDRIGIIAAGRTFHELRQALADLGIDDEALLRAGIRLLQLGMVFPLERAIVSRFADGLTDIVVVEEKRSFIEMLLRNALYGRADVPRIHGKTRADGRRLVPTDSELTADRIAAVLRMVLADLTTIVFRPTPATGSIVLQHSDLMHEARPVPVTLQPMKSVTAIRAAAFCSGCPHNISTVNATDSPSGAGVGCHALVMSMDRGAQTYTQMGGEGAQWIGRAPFVKEPHFVQNMGDGTFFHSGSLAVRFAIAAGVNMTFKLLYNGVVAMTGGQDPTGQLAVPELCALLLAEQVARIIIVADEPNRYGTGRKGTLRVPKGVSVWGRERFDEAQITLAATPGVTVLVYDQPCANELRRLRKRGKAPARPMRVVINEAVCEGCGDCGSKSSCLSVHPVDTPFGRKTQIHQASCNSDYSCLDGDCPAFVTVETDSTTARSTPNVPADIEPLESLPHVGDEGFGVYIMGVGGTGVVTMNQILATAASFDGFSVTGVDQTGLSQKGGPVVSHVKLWRSDTDRSPVVGDGAADSAIALDLLVAVDAKHLARLDPTRTRTLACTSVVPTSSMVANTAAIFGDIDQMVSALRERSRAESFATLDVSGLCEALFGEHMPANLIALGAAYQMGALPVSAIALEQAIKANGVAAERSLAAFRAGRLALSDPARLETLVHATRAGMIASTSTPEGDNRATLLVRDSAIPIAVHELAASRASELIAYQGAKLARRYLAIVEAISRTEAAADASSTALTMAVATYLHKLMAYKDEYEVARLHLLPRFDTELNRLVPGGIKMRYRLHPPVLKAIGMKSKIALPPMIARPMFVSLRAMRHTRGTAFDLFGRTPMRRLERELVEDYITLVTGLTLTAENLPAAVALASLPDQVRGYEGVKMRNVERYRAAVALGLPTDTSLT
jgi:indolepyruvate ferredoxin oxidoreductase